MTNPTTTQSAEHPWKWKKILFATTLGATGGFLGAMAFMKLGMTGNLGELGPSQEIAALVGLVYALTGVAIGIGAVRHKRRMPFVIAMTGLTFMGGALAAPHGVEEAALTIIGVALVSLGHVLNLRSSSDHRHGIVLRERR